MIQSILCYLFVDLEAALQCVGHSWPFAICWLPQIVIWFCFCKPNIPQLKNFRALITRIMFLLFQNEKESFFLFFSQKLVSRKNHSPIYVDISSPFKLFIVKQLCKCIYAVISNMIYFHVNFKCSQLHIYLSLQLNYVQYIVIQNTVWLACVI